MPHRPGCPALPPALYSVCNCVLCADIPTSGSSAFSTSTSNTVVCGDTLRVIACTGRPRSSRESSPISPRARPAASITPAHRRCTWPPGRSPASGAPVRLDERPAWKCASKTARPPPHRHPGTVPRCLRRTFRPPDCLSNRPKPPDALRPMQLYRIALPLVKQPPFDAPSGAGLCYYPRTSKRSAIPK